MKWLDDAPDDWENAPEEPPTGQQTYVPLQAEILINGVVVREPESADAYIYTSDDAALPVEDCT